MCGQQCFDLHGKAIGCKSAKNSLWQAKGQHINSVNDLVFFG